MTNAEQREAARKFAQKWKAGGDEKQDCHSFWIELLQNVLGTENVTDYIQFEKRVIVDGNTKYIDGFIDATKVLVEQKGSSHDLSAPEPQSGGAMLTPYQQAKRYSDNLPYDEKPRFILTCNFKEIRIHDMNTKQPEKDPVVILTENMQDAYHQLDFLVKQERKRVTEEVQLSIQAGELVGKIHDRFQEQYNDPFAKHTQRSLNILCVRIVFCLYAEDADLFPTHDAFCAYISQYEPKDIRRALIDLFHVLDTPVDERADLYLPEDLEAFPYVNGGLFKDENIVIPKITPEIKAVLLESGRFDWSKISPTIFGAVFESTLNPDTRRAGGMHYTSIENIHKVIDPLFLDELKAELDAITQIAVPRTKKTQLENYQKKIASLTFLDPACGSGNFLTETYLSLRRLENRVLRQRIDLEKNATAGQMVLDLDQEWKYSIQVSIFQFYGIEINDFACTVAKTALWIAESQMVRETETIVGSNIEFLPLKSYANIIEGNALRVSWEKVVQKERLSYIMGNPPFVGKSFQTKEQKADMDYVLKGIRGYGNLDYVACWYKKAADYIRETNISCALVSTNSICQGIAVPPLWRYLQEISHVSIFFAYRTFKWVSEATDAAAVHCVIIGFSCQKKSIKKLFSEDSTCSIVQNINAYLMNAPDIIIDDRHDPLNAVPKIAVGSFPTDGGNLVIKESEYEEFIRLEPNAKNYIRPYIGPEEFIKGKKRYCLWLKECPPQQLKKMPLVLKRGEQVRAYRLSSPKVQTQKRADIPFLFAEDRQPESNYILIPRTSSERRRYIPMGFLPKDVIAGDTIILPEATLYHFGILTSNVHMSWTRTVCGRLKSDYRYSGTIIYNNFPWPDPTDDQRARIEQTAQGILDARALYPESSLADLYDPLTMPTELRKAHQQNDKAVMQAYGFPIKDFSEADCVAALMKMYKALTDDKNQDVGDNVEGDTVKKI